jgi:hypothetical protein
MKLLKGILLSGVLGLVIGGLFWVHFGFAADEPERKVDIIVPVLQTEWWVVDWGTNEIKCSVFVEHDRLPTPNEVYYACGEEIYTDWVATPLCNPLEGEEATQPCEGLYIYLASKSQIDKTIEVELPLPSVLLTLSGCTLIPPENLCDTLPDLILIGDEPLPNEQIIAIHVRTENDELDCVGDRCEIPMPITNLDGIQIEFWAESSYGDTSETYKAQIRMVDAGVSKDPDKTLWYVDVLSTQWVGGEVASCSQVWDSLQPVGGPPLWLSTPNDPAKLASSESYAYLAGRLIANGIVDASSCEGGGLLENGNANSCGEIVAQAGVTEWQNQFDTAILDIAKKTNVPAYLLKNQFAVESQFWPGVWLPVEFGFGQITDNGADTALLWNDTFFSEFCPLVLDAEACSEGYLHLNDEEQELLRGALAVGTDATCPTCEMGIDLTHAEFSIDVFANTVLGNCEQTGRIIRNTTGQDPGSVASYEDLWRFTLVNYNAGPGCLANAIRLTWRLDRILDWSHLAARLDQTCSQAIDYVGQIELVRTILEAPEVEPTPTAALVVTPTATPTSQSPYPPPAGTPAYP